MSNRNRFDSPTLPHRNNPLWSGPVFSRRRFFEVAGVGVAGYYLSRVLHPPEVLAAAKVTPRNTARSCIFIFLAGGPSHVDTFDLKEGPWTPQDFAPSSYGEIRFPQGLMPDVAEQLGKLTIVRSVYSWGLVHGLLQIWTQIARNPASTLGRVAPHIGAVVALEKEERGAKLPGFIALNPRNLVGAGYLPSQYSPFPLSPRVGGLPASTHPDGEAVFETRFQLLNELDGPLRVNSPYGRPLQDMGTFYDQARRLIYDPQVDAVFRYGAEESDRYGGSSFGDACMVARNIVKSNLGAHFVQIQFGGWDHHADIYGDPNRGLYARARDFDRGFAALLQDMAAQTGLTPGNSLLDETLIVVMGEFGRTVAGLNVQQGRDHHLQQFAVFAGGGVQGGRLMGATDPTGAYTLEPGWERNRPVRAEDIAATIYSALGIDWTTVRYDDPFRRGFEYVPFASQDAYGPIEILFT